MYKNRPCLHNISKIVSPVAFKLGSMVTLYEISVVLTFGGHNLNNKVTGGRYVLKLTFVYAIFPTVLPMAFKLGYMVALDRISDI